jgi:hypothetical protein
VVTESNPGGAIGAYWVRGNNSWCAGDGQRALGGRWFDHNVDDFAERRVRCGAKSRIKDDDEVAPAVAIHSSKGLFTLLLRSTVYV